jgi:amino acid permease
MFGVFLNLFTASQIPYAISTMGWGWGLTIFTLMLLSNWWGGHVLVDACCKTDTYTWRDLGTAAFGRGGGLFIDYLQTIGIVLMGMLQTQNAGGYWGQAFPDATVCSWWWIMINSLPLLIFFQIPSFGGTSIMKYATMLTVVCVAWRMVLYFSLMGYHGPYPYKCYGGQTWSSILTGTCNMIYTFSVVNILPEMMREMTNPKESIRVGVIRKPLPCLCFACLAFGAFTCMEYSTKEQPSVSSSMVTIQL